MALRALVRSPYNKTTDAVYSVYHYVKAVYAAARYGGGYTFKPGFHASADDNLEHWPGNYSVAEAINRQEPRGVGRALDITLPLSLMILLTGRLAAAVKARDPRLRGLREFFGTLDGSVVYGRSHRGPDTAWYESTADSSHLWHLHLSVFTPFADDWDALDAVLSVLLGESLDDYLGRVMERIIAEHGDSGAWVDFIQRYAIAAGATITRDGRYGDETAAGLRWWFVNVAGGTAGTYDGRSVTGWVLRDLLETSAARTAQAVVDRAIASLPPGGAPTQAQVNAAVAAWIAANPTAIRVNIGIVTGTLGG
jgi:hypothetical protein